MQEKISTARGLSGFSRTWKQRKSQRPAYLPAPKFPEYPPDKSFQPVKMVLQQHDMCAKTPPIASPYGQVWEDRYLNLDLAAGDMDCIAADAHTMQCPAFNVH